MGVCKIFIEKHKYIVLPAVVFGFVVLLFGKMVFNGFVYDDHSLEKNRIIRTVVNPAPYFINPTTIRPEAPEQTDIYRPLSTWFFSVQSRFLGMNSFYFHLVSLFLHALNSVLFFFLLNKLVKNSTLSFFGALVFGAHPVVVETVAWAFQQSGLWSWLFSFLALLIFFFEKEAIANKFLRAAIIMVLGFGAMLAKEQAIVLPLIFIFYLLCFRLDIKKRIVEIVAIFIPALFCVFLRFTLLDSFAQIEPWFGSRLLMIFIMIPAFFYYFKLMVWPHPLSVSYDSFPFFKTFWDPAVSASAVFFIFLAAVAVVMWWRKRPLFAFGVSWIFLVFAPVSNVIFPTKQILDERFAYFMIPGLIFIVFDIIIFLKEKIGRGEKLIWAAGAGGFVVLAIFSYLTFVRIGDWENELTLWEHQMRITPDEWRTRINYGSALEYENRSEEAVVHYEHAWRLTPVLLVGRSLASIYFRTGKTENAEAFLLAALNKWFPKERDIRVILGFVYLREEKYKLAADIFESLTSEDPDNDGDLFYMILTQALSGEKMENIEFEIEKLRNENLRKLTPILIDGRKKMLVGKWQEAVDLLYGGLERYPSLLPEPYFWLAESFEKNGEIGKANAVYYLVLRNNPLSLEATQGLKRNGAW